jgi:hypothetical protein
MLVAGHIACTGGRSIVEPIQRGVMDVRLRHATAALVVGLHLGGTTGPALLAQDRPGDRQVRARAATYEPAIAAAAARHGVDPRVLWTIAYLETRFRPRLTSPAGAGGLCQLMPATAARFGVTDRYDALQSIEGAAKYVRFLSRTFGGDLDLILAGYNAGEGAVMAYRDGRSIRLGRGKIINPRRITTGGVPPYRETQQYVALGRQVFAGVANAWVFAEPRLRSASEVLGSGRLRDVERARPQAIADAGHTRSIYFADGGTPPSRALELPGAIEIAAAFTESLSPDAGPPRSTGRGVPLSRGTTRSIRFQ